jgi:hypothetical protein
MEPKKAKKNYKEKIVPKHELKPKPGKKPPGLYFFISDFFNPPKAFSRPLYHAEEEILGPGSLSSRIVKFDLFY